MNRKAAAGGVASAALARPIAMDSGPASPAWERLRFITGELTMMLELLAAGDSLRPGVASPKLIAVLMGYLAEIGNLRRAGQFDSAGASADALWQNYRQILERMRTIMPKLEQQLRNDRSRIEREQNQLGRTSAWTAAAKLTR